MKEFIKLPVTNTPRIAFYGPMCAGKTYAANHIPNAQIFSLATPIKYLADRYYGVKGKTNEERKLLQQLGDALKQFDPDVFTKYLLESIMDYYEEAQYVKYQYHGSLTAPNPVVVDDVRFSFEADKLRENGFIIIEVFTPDEIRQKRILEKYSDTDLKTKSHQSELGWIDIRSDITICGFADESIKWLVKQIYDIWK